MGIFGAAIKGFGKALKAAKRKKRRKSLGLPERTKLQQRSAAGFVKLKKKMNKGKPDLVKQSGPSKKEVIGYGTAAAAGLGASSIIKNRMKKKAGGYRDGGPVTSKRMTQENLDRIRKDQIRRNPRDFDLETGARLTEKTKMDRIKKRKKRVHKLAMGGEAAESVGRATVVKSQRDARRKLLDDSINRVYKKVSEAKKIGKIKPKKKPKNPNRIKPKTKPKKP